MIDVSTIGWIYRSVGYTGQILVYFNGLGRPFRNGGYDDPRHWFSRTWTVQEAVSFPLLGGATPSYPNLERYRLRASSGLEEFYIHFTSAFGSGGIQRVSHYITLMRKRHATKELDRISGLASVSDPQRLPIYDAKQSNEEAWDVLVKSIYEYRRAHIFFWYPVAGYSQYLWLPSWSQLMSGDNPAADRNLEGLSEIHYNEARDEFHGNFIVWDDCLVTGLNFPSLGISSESSVVRNGSITFGSQATEGPQHDSVLAYHQIAIDEAIRYTLLLPANYRHLEHSNPTDGKRFVIGVRNEVGHFQKLCVLDFLTGESYSVSKRIGSLEDIVLI